jgi:hypothetical protein
MATVRYSHTSGRAGGFQTTTIDLRDPILQAAAEKVIDKHLALVQGDAFEQSYREQDYNKIQDDAQRKIDWITRSANAITEAKEREREKTIDQISGLIRRYFLDSNVYHPASREKLKTDLIDLIRNFVEESTMLSLEEAEKMTGH